MRPAALLALAVMVGLPAAATAASDALRLEAAIYAEETRGDLAAAIEIYREISGAADADRAVVAQALFRLAACYRKTGRPAEAAAAVQVLSRDYPGHGDLLVRARALESPLDMGAEPWSDGEVLVLQARLLRVAFLRMSGHTVGGRRIWHAERYTVNGRAPWRGYRSVHVEADTWAPIRSRSVPEGGMGEAESELTYSPAAVQISTRQAQASRRVETPAHVYDHDLLQLVRRLPLAEGYRADVPVFREDPPDVRQAHVEVLGRERVTVPAGTFDTFSVDLTLWHAYALTQRVWYSADRHRYPVRVRIEDMTFDLQEVRTASDGSGVLHDVDDGAALAAPAGWLVARTARTSALTKAVITDPTMTVTGVVMREHFAPGDSAPPPAEAARRYLELHPVEGQQVAGPEAFEVAGVPAVRVTRVCADCVAYIIFFVRGGVVTTLRFDLPPELWPATRPVLDAMVSSLTFRP